MRKLVAYFKVFNCEVSIIYAQRLTLCKGRLLDSKFDDGETINGLLEEFEAKVKPNFDNAGRKYSIKIPGVKASIKDLGILNGCLKLAG